MDIKPGAKIKCHGNTGTIGIMVEKKTRPQEKYLLSCWHLLDGGNPQGQVLIANNNDEIIAEYKRSSGTAILALDAAIARIDPRWLPDVSNTLVHTDIDIATVVKPGLTGSSLFKVSENSGQSICIVDKRLDRYGNLGPALRLSPHPMGKNEYAVKGDSGAVWCSIADSRPVAMHARGGLGNNHGAAVELRRIFRALDLRVWKV